MKNSKLYVSLENFDYNIKQIKNKLSKNTKIMAMIKADAYGNGAENLVEILSKNDINYVAVATICEGEALRKVSQNLNIVVLNQPIKSQIPEIINGDLICGVCDENFITTLNDFAGKYNKKGKIHLEIDTGAGRNGIYFKNLKEMIALIKELKNLELEGIFTHFTCADSDDEYTLNQIEIFNKCIVEVKEAYANILVHAANSAGIVNYPEAYYDMVRPGLLLYGYYPDAGLKNKINVKPIEKWVSKVSYIKKMPKGSGISYDKTFVTEHDSTIAVIPVGYADGYMRAFSNKADVLINGIRAKVVGRVCMDMIMVDVTDIPDVKVGDEVYLFDNDEITVEELANIADTINYEIISRIGKRVAREYL